jgi:hypothetical protein
MGEKLWTGNDLEESNCGQLEILNQHVPVGNEKFYKKPP